MKRRAIISLIATAIILTATGCQSKSTTDTNTDTVETTVESTTLDEVTVESDTQTQEEATTEESEVESTITEEETTETEPETIQIVEEVTEEISEQDETSFGTLENLTYTVDLTDIFPDDYNVLVGNTSTLQGYSGIIVINISDYLSYKLESIELEKGKTYVVTTSPMISRSIPPQVTAIDIVEATDSEIDILEKTREIVSNYDDCMSKYADMSLDDIISDSNSNYATWTQQQIYEFKEYLTEKGYTDDYELHSYVELRPNLDGNAAY
jgi:hypothetical protein